MVSASAGDVIMANPGEMHDGMPFDSNPRRWRMIYIDPVLVASEVEEETLRPVEIVRPVARDQLLAGLFARLFVCLIDPRPDRLALDETLLRSLMHILSQHGTTPPAYRGPSPCVAKAIERLNANPEAPVSLAELAALSGVSRFQLMRGFAREVGITPHAYLVQRRVCLARRLLAGGQTPARVAIEAGFADQSHMTRAFVRHLGITPSRYQAAVS